MEREEGELTDEDLEDVSDNSSELSSIPIALVTTGKSPLRREPFRELSLTSISDEDDVDDDSDSLLLDKTTYRHISRNLYRSSRQHSHKYDKSPPSSSKRARRFSERHNNNNNNKRRRNTSIHNSNSRRDYSSVSSSSSDDSNNYKNKTILRQLRDAVRINRSQIVPNCSLRSRLKRMIEPSSQTSNSSDDDNLDVLRDQALQSKVKNNDQTEKQPESNKNDEDLAQLRLIALKSAVIKKHAERRKRKEELLKQQSVTTEEKQPEVPEPKQINEVEDKNNTIEEDEDILRAMLLTSISKKIADKKTNQPLPNKPNKPNKPSKPNKPNNNNYQVNQGPPPINRFIIKVNSDSESDSDDKKPEQKPETKQQNPKSDIFDKSLSLFLQQARAKTEQDKSKHQSDISHLPRSQQIEYKRLKRQLQILSTRMKPVNINNKKKLPGDENKKLTNLNLNTNNTNKFVAHAQQQTPATAAPRTKDDRLMIKGKYEELTPLMSRVSEARNARDKTQAEVKRLINNLRTARAQLTANHQEYTVLVQQLVKAKADIDKRAEIQERKNRTIHKLSTSTPIKLLPLNNVVNNVVVTAAIPTTNEQMQIEDMDLVATPEPQLPEPEVEPIIETEPESVAEPELEKNDIQVEVSVTDEMMDVVETVPEITEIINIKKELTILEYNSPLEHIQLSRKQPLQNPLLELCPYDLLGVCRDADCSYQHCGNTQQTS